MSDENKTASRDMGDKTGRDMGDKTGRDMGDKTLDAKYGRQDWTRHG